MTFDYLKMTATSGLSGYTYEYNFEVSKNIKKMVSQLHPSLPGPETKLVIPLQMSNTKIYGCQYPSTTLRIKMICVPLNFV